MIALIILPGIAPTYVLRWPLISASSFTPPSETLINLRFNASAIDLANVVLPTPGGPIKVRIGILLTASFVEDPSLLINNLVSKKHSLSPFIGK